MHGKPTLRVLALQAHQRKSKIPNTLRIRNTSTVTITIQCYHPQYDENGVDIGIGMLIGIVGGANSKKVGVCEGILFVVTKPYLLKA